ncbi:hypothetical protein GTA07_29955, partial [Rhodococcus hoagii]|nr:hypothetical protein [Prescottella equi]
MIDNDAFKHFTVLAIRGLALLWRGGIERRGQLVIPTEPTGIQLFICDELRITNQVAPDICQCPPLFWRIAGARHVGTVIEQATMLRSA